MLNTHNMADNNDVLIKWQKRTFWMRTILLSLILIALIIVAIRAGGDPCDRCKLKTPLSDVPMTCREIITQEILPKYQKQQDLPDLPPSPIDFRELSSNS